MTKNLILFALWPFLIPVILFGLAIMLILAWPSVLLNGATVEYNGNKLIGRRE